MHLPDLVPRPADDLPLLDWLRTGIWPLSGARRGLGARLAELSAASPARRNDQRAGDRDVRHRDLAVCERLGLTAIGNS